MQAVAWLRQNDDKARNISKAARDLGLQASIADLGVLGSYAPLAMDAGPLITPSAE